MKNKKSRIHFLGTLHDDPLGPIRLRKALEIEAPNIITVESSPQFEVYRESEWLNDMLKILEFWKQHGLKDHVYELLKDQILNVYGYEIEISKEYASERGLPIHFIDDPKGTEIVKEALKKLERKGDINFMNRTTLERLIARAERTYEDFEGAFKSPDELQFEYGVVDGNRWGLGLRDKVAAVNMGRIMEPDKRVVHVGGFIHCLNDYKKETLYSRMSIYDRSRSTIGNQKYN